MALELDIRTAEITGETLGCGAKAAEADLRQAIEIYTEKKLLETVAYAKANSGSNHLSASVWRLSGRTSTGTW